jgi:hypothetical protein
MNNPLCPNCQAPLTPGSKFCGQCGAKTEMTTPTLCLECGFQLSGNEKFCPNCGRNFEVSSLQNVKAIDESPFHKNDAISLIANWVGATRALHAENDELRYQSFVAGALNMASSGRLANMGETVENLLFIDLITTYSSGKFINLVNRLLQQFPGRFGPMIKNPKLLSTLKDFNNTFLQFWKSWPYKTYLILWNAPQEQLMETCLQTMREGFYVESLSCISKLKFLEEERIRIDADLYPRSLKPELERFHSKLQRSAKKIEADLEKYGGSPVEANAKMIKGLIAPLSLSEVVEQINQATSMSNTPNPFAYEPLGDWDNKQLAALIEGEYDLQDMVNFFVSRHEDESKHMQMMQQMGGLAGGLAVLEPWFRMSQYMVTTILNMLSRRLNPVQHRDYQVFPPSPFKPNLVYELMSKQDIEMAKAYKPPVNSLFLAEHISMKSSPNP